MNILEKVHFKEMQAVPEGTKNGILTFNTNYNG
jgi:hypothetical protein